MEETRLARIRREKGFSQGGLSKAAGVNVHVIQHYEGRQRNINRAAVEIVRKLADALGVNIIDIMEE